MIRGQVTDRFQSTHFIEKLSRHDIIVSILFFIWIIALFVYIINYTLYNSDNNLFDTRINARYKLWKMFPNVNKTLFV
jgi:hypothetical protein